MADPSNPEAIDPAKSLKRSLDQLTVAVKAMTKHMESLESTSQADYLSEQKESNAAKKIREAGWSVQEAQKPPDQLTSPGTTNQGASTISEVVQSIKESAEKTPQERAVESVLQAGQISANASNQGSGFSANEEAITNALRDRRIREAGGQQGPAPWVETEEENQKQEQLSLKAKEQAQIEKRAQGMERWMPQEQAEELAKEKFKLPRGGRQKKRRIEENAEAVRTGAGILSGKLGESEFPGSDILAKGAGGIAAGAGTIGENAGKIAGALTVGDVLLDPLSDMFTKTSKFSAQATQLGGALGYNTNNALGGRYLPGGIPNPLAVFSSGGEQGAGIELSALESMFFGQDNPEAKKIAQRLAMQGWSNRRESGLGGLLGVPNAGRNAELTELVSKMKEGGLSESTSYELTEKIRYGQGSIKGLAETMSHLSSAAKEAQVSTDWLARSAMGYAEATKGQGRQLAQINKGLALTEMTGRPAGEIFAAAESGVGQALAGTYGILPGTLAGTNPAFQGMVGQEATKFYLGMTRGAIPNVINPYTHREMGHSTKEVNEARAAEVNMLSGGQVSATQALAQLEHPNREAQMPFAITETAKAIENAKRFGGNTKPGEWHELELSTNEVVNKKQLEEAYKIDKGGIKSREKLQADVQAAVANQEGEQKWMIGLSKDAKKWFQLHAPEQFKQYEKEANEGSTPMAERATGKSTGKSSNPLINTLGSVAGTGLHVAEDVFGI